MLSAATTLLHPTRTTFIQAFSGENSTENLFQTKPFMRSTLLSYG